MNWNHRWIWIRFKISSLCKILSFLLFLLRLAGRHLHAILCKDIWEKTFIGDEGAHSMLAKLWRTRALGMARSHQCLNLRRWNSLFDLLHVHILRNTHSTRFKIASVVSQIFDIFYAVVIPSPPPPPSSIYINILAPFLYSSTNILYSSEHYVRIFSFAILIIYCMIVICLPETRFQRSYERFALARGQKHQQQQQQWLEKWTMTHKLLQAV